LNTGTNSSTALSSRPASDLALQQVADEPEPGVLAIDLAGMDAALHQHHRQAARLRRLGIQRAAGGHRHRLHRPALRGGAEGETAHRLRVGLLECIAQRDDLVVATGLLEAAALGGGGQRDAAREGGRGAHQQRAGEQGGGKQGTTHGGSPAGLADGNRGAGGHGPAHGHAASRRPRMRTCAIATEPIRMSASNTRMTLYYAPGAASFLVHWLLIDLDAPHALHLVDTAARAQKSPEYLALNPNGVVPTLVVDGRPHYEAAALAMLLAERHPDAGLAPAFDDPRRADYLQWMFNPPACRARSLHHRQRSLRALQLLRDAQHPGAVPDHA
jgi:hypothetical protein